MLDEITAINVADLEASQLDASSSVESSAKRPYPLEDSVSELINKDHWAEERTKRCKKFRAEWLNVAHFKDWLQPHHTDETYCICVACNIKLRCGKSELEKHASGLKHSKRVEAMKEDPNFKHRTSAANAEHSPSKSSKRILCEESGTFFALPCEQHPEDGFDDQEPPLTIPHSTLSTFLSKLSEFMDFNSEVSKKKIEMAEKEHECRMQILNKELELKTLELKIKQAELQKLSLEQQGKVYGVQRLIVNNQTDQS